MTQIAENVKAISNPAKILGAYMRCSGVTCAKTLAETLNVPLRTIQRLKLEYATGDVAEVSANDATCANDAIYGAATCANSATDGVTKQSDQSAPHIEERARLKENPSGLSYTEEKIDPPLTPPSPVQTRSWEDDVAAQTSAHPSITIENGKVVLHNGTRAEWLERFGGDEEDLELALIDAFGTIQPNSRQDPAAQIRRRLSIIVRDRREKDKRYQAAVASNRKTAVKPAVKLSRW